MSQLESADLGSEQEQEQEKDQEQFLDQDQDQDQVHNQENENGQASPSPLSELSYDVIEEFLAEKWQDLNCEVCKKEDTWIVSEEDARFAVLPAITKDDTISLIAKSVYVGLFVFCKNCGNIKLLNAEVVVAWKNSDSA